MLSKTLLIGKTSLIASLILLSACNRRSNLPTDISSSLGASIQSTSSSDADEEIKAAIPKILEGLDDIKDSIKDLRSTGLSVSSKPTTGAKPTTKPGTTKPSGSKPTTTKPPTSGSTGSSTKPPAATPSATEELLKVLKFTSEQNFAEISLEKTEKHLTEGRVTTGRLNMWSKKPNIVKLDVTYASTGSAGSKVLYTSGEGDKVKVRPAGAAGFLVVDLAKTDDRIDSTNRYLLDDLDFFGIVKRLSSGYTAELIGKSEIAGATIHILKVTTTGTNSLDERISHEYIGYEPDSLKIRLWETYTADSKEPFMRFTINKINYPSTLSDSLFKL